MSEPAVYATPQAELSTGTEHKEYPGLRRLPYVGWSLALQLVYAAAVSATATAAPALLWLVLIAQLAASAYLLVQRLRNTGASGWWALGIIVPVLNFYVGIKALAFPEGYDDHRQLDTAAKVIVGLFLCLLFGGIVIAMAGFLGAP